MLGHGLKDELREIGRDVASSLKDELKGVAKEKATAFVKEQFGLGFKDELKAAGRDILDEVGSQLKGAAKDKATELIREQLGLGYGGSGIARPCAIRVGTQRETMRTGLDGAGVPGRVHAGGKLESPGQGGVHQGPPKTPLAPVTLTSRIAGLPPETAPFSHQ